MKLQEAIEILKDVESGKLERYHPDAHQAFSLLIEAAKRELEYREGESSENFDLLPGETEE